MREEPHNFSEMMQDPNLQGGDICRDFLRNVCTRNHCKYIHPSKAREETVQDGNPSTTSNTSRNLVFCHDFQNSVCNRNSRCRFVHGSRADEEVYKATGELPKHIRQDVRNFLKKDSRVEDAAFVLKEIPLCKDHHLKGECQRGKKCKFLHMKETKSFYKETEDKDIPEAKRRHQESDRHNIPTHHFNNYTFRDGSNSTALIHQSMNYTSEYHASISGSNLNLSASALFEENLLLKRKLDDLRKQVNDLQATNEFLLDQNAHLRIQGKLLPSVSMASSITVPVTTSVTYSSLPTMQAIHPYPGCMTSIPNVQTVQAVNASIFSSAPLVSIAPVTINHQTALAPQNSSISAGTATVTLTPTINAAAVQLQRSNSLAFSGSNGNSIVSYDSYPAIMTQSLMASSC